MENNSRNFGERLRALIESKRQSNGEFAAAYGIAESQLYNWLKREAPPLHKHWQKLADYFGCSVDHIAYGTPLNAEESGVSGVEEAQAPYGELRESTPTDDSAGEAESITAKIQEKICELMTAAQGDPVKLGWVHEQVSIHLRPPAHWPKPIARPAPNLPPLSSPRELQQPSRQRETASG